MIPGSLTFSGGLLMGLASSLHCAGMCGGISATLLLALGRGDGLTAQAGTLAAIQIGRVLSYVTMGALVGSLGAGLLGGFDHATLYRLMRTAAALSLGWIGLSLTGLAPGIQLLDRLFTVIAGHVQGIERKLPFGSLPARIVAGMAWGFIPCGMVYGALFFAMITGSLLGGAQVMAGFALGTVPAVVAAAAGVASLRHMAQSQKAQIAVGTAIIALAAATALIPAATFSRLCGA